jgi:hypothetical protein
MEEKNNTYFSLLRRTLLHILFRQCLSWLQGNFSYEKVIEKCATAAVLFQYLTEVYPKGYKQISTVDPNSNFKLLQIIYCIKCGWSPLKARFSNIQSIRLGNGNLFMTTASS